MYIIKTSTRAFLFALAPFAVLHLIFLAQELLIFVRPPSVERLPAPDLLFSLWLVRVTLDGLLLFSGHLLARYMGYGSRSAYSLMGGAAGVGGYLIAGSLDFGSRRSRMRSSWQVFFLLPSG